MTFNRAGLDKYLMCFFIGLLMIAAGLSSTDRWWAAIGGVVVGLTVLVAAIDIYGWIRGQKDGEESDGKPPSRRRVILMLPICILIACGSIILGGTQGIILAVLLVLSYSALAFLTFWDKDPSVKLMSFDTSKPVGAGTIPADGELFAAMTGDPQQDEETLRRYLAEHPGLLDGPRGLILNTLTGGRLTRMIAEGEKELSVERTPDGVVMRRDVHINTVRSGDEILSQLASAVMGRPEVSRAQPGKTEVAETAESLLAQGDECRSSGTEAEARAAYERAEVLALVDWANGTTRDKGLLPTVLVRLGKIEAARRMIAEELAKAPNDSKLLLAQALVESVQETPGV